MCDSLFSMSEEQKNKLNELLHEKIKKFSKKQVLDALLESFDDDGLADLALALGVSFDSFLK